MSKTDELIQTKSREVYEVVKKQVTNRVPQATAIPQIENVLGEMFIGMKNAAATASRTETQNLKAKIKDLDEVIDELKESQDPDKISKLLAEVETLETENKELQEKTETLTKENGELLAKIEELETPTPDNDEPQQGPPSDHGEPADSPPSGKK